MGRKYLMIEEVKRVIDQLKDDPDLTGMTRSPVDNPYES
jgi:hypothetical protein